MKRFAGKRYLVFVTVKQIETIDEFKFDKTEYSNMDDWFPVGNIEKVKI